MLKELEFGHFWVQNTLKNPTLVENIRYLMHKYKLDIHKWYGSITPLFNKIDLYYILSYCY